MFGSSIGARFWDILRRGAQFTSESWCPPRQRPRAAVALRGAAGGFFQFRGGRPIPQPSRRVAEALQDDGADGPREVHEGGEQRRNVLAHHFYNTPILHSTDEEEYKGVSQKPIRSARTSEFSLPIRWMLSLRTIAGLPSLDV